jgi:hypothetical protein
MDTTGGATPATHFAGAAGERGDPILRIWYSEHVDQYRWVLTFGSGDADIFHGNATSLEQAMSDVDHCRLIHEGATG